MTISGSACLLMAGFWSQSDTGHLDRISLVLPLAITNTRNALFTEQNVGATCRQSPLISQNGSDRLPKRPNHTNRSVIFHTLLSNILTGTVSNSGLRQGSAGQHSSDQHMPWLVFLWQNIRFFGEKGQPLLYPAAGKEYSGINHIQKLKYIHIYLFYVLSSLFPNITYPN